MKKLSRMLAVVMTAALLTAGASTALAARPDDAKVYADFNNGPMAEPEQTMQATDEGGALYINDGPIDAKAELSDGALKLTLGPTGYYGMQNGAVQLRDIDGKLTAYKYLVVRMKGEKGQENVSGNGVLMMSIGGGDGSHIGTFNAEAAGGPTPFLDPDGKTMPTITTEYQDFVIALTEDNVRKNPGKAVTGINFNNSVGQLTVYIDEIYLTNTVPEGYENNGSTPVTPPTTGSGNDTNSAPENNNGSGNNAANQNNTNTPSAGGSASSGMSTANVVMIIVVAVMVALNIIVLVYAILQLSKKR